jgi:hypothetical protein
MRTREGEVKPRKLFAGKLRRQVHTMPLSCAPPD